MVAKKNTETNEQVTEVKATEDKLIFKANKPLTEVEFTLLSDLVKKEEAKADVKIVLMPYSADLVEEDNG